MQLVCLLTSFMMSACFSDVTCICDVMSHFGDVRWQCWHHLLSLNITVAIKTVMETPFWVPFQVDTGIIWQTPPWWMLLCTEHKLFSKTYILCIQRFGSSTVSFTAREYTYITWGYYLMGQALVSGTFLRAIAHAYCTLVPREVLKVLPRLNDLVTEFYFL